MRRHRLLPLCALLGVLCAGLLPNLEAQEGKSNLVHLGRRQQGVLTVQMIVNVTLMLFSVFVEYNL